MPVLQKLRRRAKVCKAQKARALTLGLVERLKTAADSARKERKCDLFRTGEMECLLPEGEISMPKRIRQAAHRSSQVGSAREARNARKSIAQPLAKKRPPLSGTPSKDALVKRTRRVVSGAEAANLPDKVQPMLLDEWSEEEDDARSM